MATVAGATKESLRIGALPSQLSSSQLGERISLQTAEEVISCIYIPRFEECLRRSYWITARKILEFARDLDYHGPAAGEFYDRVFTIISQMPYIPAKWTLTDFLLEARKTSRFLVPSIRGIEEKEGASV